MIFAVFSCFSVVSQPFFPFGILWHKTVVLGSEMKWIARLYERFAFIRGMLLWRSISSLILCLFNEKV